MITQKFSLGLVILLVAMVARPAVTAPQSTDKNLGIIRLRYVTIVVRDYDEALRWYTDVLGLEKTEEGSFGKGQRWIVVASPGQKDLGIILEIAKPYSVGTNMSPTTAGDSIRNYAARVGGETRWVFEVEDCRRFHDSASKRGLKFVGNPVDQPWGVTEAMFEDLYGNLFVVQSSRPTSGSAVR